MQLPTVHMNGTSGAELIEQQREVRRHLFQAMDALRRAAPNGRDYYPQGREAYDRARQEWHHRLTRIDAVNEELGQLAEAIMNLTEGREPVTATTAEDPAQHGL